MNAVTLTSSFPATVQPGIPKLGEKPEGWTRAPLGRFLTEVRRPIKMVDDHEYRLVTVKRARGGVVDRGTFLGRDVLVKSQFLLEPGDFLISKRQIVHGACGLVPEALGGAVVSNEYAVLNGSEDIDLGFLNYLAHSIFFQQTCFHSSIGVHVEKMIFKLDRWLNFEFDLPPLSEQRKIADILSTWARAIETTEALLATAQTQKRALMQSLLTGQRRFPEFEGQEWKEVRLGEVIDITYGKSPKEIIVEEGQWPVIGTGGITGRTNSTMAEGPAIVIGRKGTIDCPQWIEGKFWCIDTTYFCKPRTGVDLRWVYAWLGSINLKIYNEASGVPSLSRETLKAIRLELPGKSEQSRIADAFVVCDAEIASLSEQIEKLRTEKKALMQQLLTGKRRVVV